MMFTRSSAMAVYAVVHVADAGKDVPCRAPEIASALGVSLDTLIKVLQQLVRARILSSIRGRSGGFRLARPPSRVTLLDIVEAIDGPVGGTFPLPGLKGKRRIDRELNRSVEEAGRALRRVLSGCRVSDLQA